MKSSPILVIYRKQLGDLVLLQPVLQLLAERYGVNVLVRTRPGFTDVLALMPGDVRLAGRQDRSFSQVYCLDTKASSLLDAVTAFPARRNLVLTRPGEAWWNTFFFSRVWCASGLNQYRAHLFHQALGGNSFHSPRLMPPPDEWQPVGLPERYFILHPTSAWQRKTWPAQSWIALLERLLPICGLPLVLTSGNEAWEQEMAGTIASAFPERVLNLAGKTSLRAYLSLLSKAESVLTVDGSASHLAAAFDRRLLTLFGPTNPVHWHCPTPNSRRLSASDYSAERRPAVAAIPVEDVFRAACELMQGNVNG